MNKIQLEEQIKELESKYKDEEVETNIGTLHTYYTFKAGQIGWEKCYDNYKVTEENLKQAKNELIRSFGYLGRDSKIIAIKKCYLKEEKEIETFKYN